MYVGPAENYSSGSTTMVSHVQVPTNPGKENTFIEGKTDSESQFSTAHSFSLAGSLPGKKSFFFLLDSALRTGCESFPILASQFG